MREEAKGRAARAAVEQVPDGAVVGLGSGSTAAHGIRALGERIEEGANLVGVPTSYQAADVARSVGVPVRGLADVSGIDVAIDGADQVAGAALIKGGGGAQAREKVVDAAAERLLIVVDETKVSATLEMPIPIEILPDARPAVTDRLAGLGATPTIRQENDRPFVTDNGNHVIDADFGTIDRPASLATELAAIPGILEHGLFIDLADTVYVGNADGVDILPE